MLSEAEVSVDLSILHHSQCWEDADILLEGLDIKPGDVCVSVASSGDNVLAMLTRSPSNVVALETNPAQIACLELRLAAFKELEYEYILELVGSRPSERRADIYKHCRGRMSKESQDYWNKRIPEIEKGLGNAGKFENYLRIFREYILPIVHSNERIQELFNLSYLDKLKEFYNDKWDNWGWRMMFRLVFSRPVLEHLARGEKQFLANAGEELSRKMFQRARYALTEILPRGNPYVQWILTGTHMTALPFYLRKENYEVIKERIDFLEWKKMSMEEYLAWSDPKSIDRINLGNALEYMPQEDFEKLLGEIVRVGKPGGRLAYWNLLIRRYRPEEMAGRLNPLEDLSDELLKKDKAFFYGDFIVNEIV
jgi:S-adenosylmethionine-diacylglycerol 3-amino-3-carboxypropyl transferase